jgi:hypothetical protein
MVHIGFWLMLMMRGSLRTIKEKAEALVVVSKENKLEVNAENTKYMVLSQEQNAGRSRSMKNDNRSFERVKKFKYLENTLTNQAILKFGAESFDFQSAIQKLKIKIYITVIMPVVSYGCATWSLTLRKDRRLRVRENRTLRRIFGPKRDEGTRKWKKLHYD